MREGSSEQSVQQPGAGKTVSRDEFDAMPQIQRARFIKDGGSVNNMAKAGPPAKSSAPATGKTMHRATFETLSPQDRMNFVRADGKVVD